MVFFIFIYIIIVIERGLSMMINFGYAIQITGMQNNRFFDSCLHLELEEDLTNKNTINIGNCRYNEESHRYDNYNARSAEIYETYARQLNISDRTMRWTKSLILNSCEPILKSYEDIPVDGNFIFFSNILYVVHHLDLMRCHSSYELNKVQEKLGEIYPSLFDDTPKEVITENLFDFAERLCKVTGSHLEAKDIAEDPILYAKMSLDGGLCWKAVSNEDLDWKAHL